MQIIPSIYGRYGQQRVKFHKYSIRLINKDTHFFIEADYLPGRLYIMYAKHRNSLMKQVQVQGRGGNQSMFRSRIQGQVRHPFTGNPDQQGKYRLSCTVSRYKGRECLQDLEILFCVFVESKTR